MKLTDAFSARSVALALTEERSNSLAYLGKQFFPSRKKMGMDLKWVKAHKGLPVSLMPSALDSLATIRPREGFTMQSTKMPFFRESMKVDEEDLYTIQMARDSRDPYVADVVRRVFDDAGTLLSGAEVAQERMRMALLAPVSGNMVISIGLSDNTAYTYNYDPNGTWKASNYVALSGTSTWTVANKATSAPLDNLQTAKQALAAKGYRARYAVMNTVTFNGLSASEQIKNAFLTANGMAVGYVSPEAVRSVVSAQTDLQILIYDKQYLPEGSTTAAKFMPDGYVSIVCDDVLGNTYFGTTPEELSLLADPKVDVALVDNAVAVTEQITYGPPVGASTTVSQICLPSFENMDGLYVIKAQ